VGSQGGVVVVGLEFVVHVFLRCLEAKSFTAEDAENAERVKVYVALEIPGAGSQNCGLALISSEH
jgi:hypothetical protein